MIFVDESQPEGDPSSQFCHRKVAIKRSRDVRETYDVGGEIGRGKFGKVMKCVHRGNGQTFAAKFVACPTREDRRNVEREVEIMNLLRSPKLLQLYDAFENGGRTEMCLITEYIGGGELFDRVIEDEFVLTERACACFAKQILEGVSYIHHQNVIHLDLKPENILCLTKSGNRVKIIDFGLARKFEPRKKMQVLFGTPEFVAPEVVGFEPISYATDMWAVGVICYVLLSGLSPFMGDTDLETMANVTIAEYDYDDEVFDNVSQAAKDFIDGLLIKDKEKRLTADQCLKHLWLRQQLSGDLEGSLNAAKNNLSAHKGQWESGQPEFLFDRPSMTISVASSSSAPIGASSTDCQKEDEPQVPSPKSPIPAASPPPLVLSPSTDSVKSTAKTITLDQIKRKAEEIVERKSSFTSKVGQEEEGEEKDHDGTPTCQSPTQECPKERGDPLVPSSSSSSSTLLPSSSSSEPTTPKTIGLPLVTNSDLCCEVQDCQPLWQTAERTLTPLWELATNHSTLSDQNSSSPAFGSSDVSKSNSELSIKNLLNPGRCLKLAPHHPDLVLLYNVLSSPPSTTSSSSVMPASSVSSKISSNAATTPAGGEASDQSSWDNNSLTDNESVRESEAAGHVKSQLDHPIGQSTSDGIGSATSQSGDGGLHLQHAQIPPDEEEEASSGRDERLGCPPICAKPFHPPAKPLGEEEGFGGVLGQNDQAAAKEEVDIDSLLAEVDQHISFSLSSIAEGESKKRADDGSVAHRANKEAMEEVKSDLSSVRRDLSAIKSDLGADRKPLMEMMNNFISNSSSSRPIPCAPATVVKPRDSSYLSARRPSADLKSDEGRRKEMDEVEKAITQLAKTIEDFQSSSEDKKSCDLSPSAIISNSRKDLFSSANTGSVYQARNKFERKESTDSGGNQVPPSSPASRQRSTTPFRSARSPSPLPGACIRHRSPSPVKTGKVDRVRNRFEVSSTPSASPQPSLFSHSGHRTLPKAFKLGAASRVKSINATSEVVIAPRERQSSEKQGRSSGPVVKSHHQQENPTASSRLPSKQPPQPPPRSAKRTAQGAFHLRPNSFTSSSATTSPGLLRPDPVVKGAAHFLSQRLSGLSAAAMAQQANSKPFRAPAMVNSFSKVPYGYAE